MSELEIPELCLVVLVGTSGAGKSTFGRAHFRSTEVLSSDTFRGLVADDENDQSATKDAFDALHFVAGRRLAAGRLTVVDATNVQVEARKPLVALAREHDVLPVAIVLDLPEQVCVARNASRADRTFGPEVISRQRSQLRRSLRGLAREGFRRVHVLRSEDEIAAATITRTRLYNDLRHEAGPFDAIGDVHGCREELELLLARLGYELRRDELGRAVGARHPEGRRAILLGDLVDRGPDTPGVLRLAMGMHADGDAVVVPGNHEQKLVRALRGRNVQVTHGLAESLAQLADEPAEFRASVEAWMDGLVSHYVLDGGALVVCHAGLPERFHGRASNRVRQFCLYGETTGETDEFGLPVRYPWADDYRGRATVLYGHTPVPDATWVNGTMCLDTGCVFGGRLSALRWPERELVQVPATAVHYAPAKPFPVNADLDDPSSGGGAGGGALRREPDLLDVADVLRTTGVETQHRGRISVRAENAAAALEVMSRFAVDPRWLVHLPPTMSPVATSTRDGLLEHPEQVFEAYRAEGVGDVVCEEKHMGSRAVLLACRDQAAAAARFGTAAGGAGAVWTRTGRSFFPPPTTAELVGRVASALEAAGIFDELGSSWVLLDAEILPWSAKALELVRQQYASVGTAARTALPIAAELVEQSLGRGLSDDGTADLAARLRSRASDAEAFSAAYRAYCWPTDGLSGVQVAPFQVLAAEGATFHDRPHVWHLAVADRLVAADPELFRTTQRRLVGTTDDAAVAAATAWWEELVGGGGEGMVVKPAGNLVRGRKGLVQPGLKVRGPEYLRIIYGPHYREPANLDRLRQRGLGAKRSLALREHALGLEGLDRLARGEPLWRVHECVFAVLALESEPVDPRL